MIIELHDSLIEVANGSKDGKTTVQTALNTLALARREGNHIVFGQISTLHKLLKIDFENQLTTAVLRRSINKFPQKAAIAERLRTKILVGDFKTLEIDNISENGRRVLRLPVERLNLSLVQKPLLLVENLTDAQFYRILTEQSEIGTIPLSFEAYPGGGDTTADALEHISTLNRLCLCIVDSDIRFSTSSVGETAKKVKKKFEDIQPSVVDLYVLPVTSVENLIPIETLRKSCGDDTGQIKCVDELYPLYCDAAWPYLRLKKGLRCIDVIEKKTASALFWSEIIGEHDLLHKCASTGNSAVCKSKKCDIFLFPPLASNTLKRAVALVESDRKFEGAVHIAAAKSGWTEISNLMAAWCCAGEKMYGG